MTSSPLYEMVQQHAKVVGAVLVLVTGLAIWFINRGVFCYTFFLYRDQENPEESRDAGTPTIVPSFIKLI